MMSANAPQTLTISYDTLWPYSREQAEKIVLLRERFKHWKGVFEDLINFFAAIESIESHAAKDYRKTMKIFENKLDENMPGLKSALDCVGYVGDEHQRFAKVISDNCIKRLENLKHDFTKKLKNIKGDIDTAMTAVTKERQETMEAIQEHRKAHEMVNVRRGTSGDLTDPWLTEKALQMQLERMVQQENYYQMRMLAIQNDIKECEKVLVVTLKAIADDFVFGKETSFTHLREHMSTIKAVIDRVDPTFHFDTFVAQHNITGSPIWHTERTVRDFTYKSNEEAASSVLKEGIIQRPGTIRKSHWKNSWFVLTDNGFLHCFDDQHTPFPDSAGSSPASPTSPSSPTLRRNSTKSSKKGISPMYTINLRQSRVQAHFVQDKPCENVFEITIQPILSSGSGVFHIFNSKSAEPKKYQLRALTEEDLVDWVCLLKKKIASYIPESPPEPLFSPPETIAGRINEKMAESAKEKSQGSLSRPSSQEIPQTRSPVESTHNVSISRQGSIST